jgi:hypothetical protein
MGVSCDEIENAVMVNKLLSLPFFFFFIIIIIFLCKLHHSLNFANK